MKKQQGISILIPVLNEEKHLPKLFPALAKQKLPNSPVEIIFINNGSTDASEKLMQAWKKSGKKFSSVRVIQSSKPGRANSLQYGKPIEYGFREAKGENIITLDADCIPSPNWLIEMEKAFTKADLIVGNTESYLPRKPSDAEKLADIFFKDYSFRAAHAEGFALPWGPACNFGIKASALKKCGSVELEARAAFDMDLCWRAILSGASIYYAKDALVAHQRRNNTSAFYRQMYNYGTGEAWIYHRYKKILDFCDERSVLEKAQEGARRIQGIKCSAILSSLKQQASIAFACGVYAGFSNFKIPKELAILRKRASTISWRNAKGHLCVFVPGKGMLIKN